MADRARRHLCVFIYALTGGGAQRRTLTLARGFAERGHRVDLVLVRPDGRLAAEVPSSVRVVSLASARGGPRLVRALFRRLGLRGLETAASLGALARYLRRERPEVLLSAASHVNLVAVGAWRLARVPVRLVLRASNDPLGDPRLWPRWERAVRAVLRWTAGRVYPWADAVIAVSDGVAEQIACLTGIPRERITTIYNPVVTPELLEKAREPLGHAWFAPGQPPVVLGVGKLKVQKGFRTLIRAFARVRAARPARLVILGEGARRRALEALVDELGLREDAALPGWVDNPWAWMARASVFALSSRWEGLPGALIEAMACGCPVVATDCPSGPAEILAGGAYGPLVPVGDADALAAAILALLDAPPDPARLRARAASFSVDPAVDRYLEVLLGAPTPRRDEASPPLAAGGGPREPGPAVSSAAAPR
jgi:glycosyltransferase involved in cell wall biosynthesis